MRFRWANGESNFTNAFGIGWQHLPGIEGEPSSHVSVHLTSERPLYSTPTPNQGLCLEVVAKM